MIPVEAPIAALAAYCKDTMAAAVRAAAPIVVAAELLRLAQEVHDDGALATWTALDVEMLLRSRAAELGGTR